MPTLAIAACLLLLGISPTSAAPGGVNGDAKVGGEIEWYWECDPTYVTPLITPLACSSSIAGLVSGCVDSPMEADDEYCIGAGAAGFAAFSKPLVEGYQQGTAQVTIYDREDIGDHAWDCAPWALFSPAAYGVCVIAQSTGEPEVTENTKTAECDEVQTALDGNIGTLNGCAKGVTAAGTYDCLQATANARAGTAVFDTEAPMARVTDCTEEHLAYVLSLLEGGEASTQSTNDTITVELVNFTELDAMTQQTIEDFVISSFDQALEESLRENWHEEQEMVHFVFNSMVEEVRNSLEESLQSAEVVRITENTESS